MGHNQRFTASPEAVHVVRTTGEGLAAVDDAVRSGRRLSVRSGGHCYADLVYHPEAEVIVDLSTMNRIDYDPARRAFMIEPGARLGEIYETLYRRWGVTLPGGLCPYVGIGGHATGGGYGILTRRDGVVADHIDAVEMVVVDADGTPRVVTASRASTGDLNDLWWAATGGGGGSFGLITRFWFRSAGARGTDPGGQLPRPPSEMLTAMVELPWDRLDEAGLAGLLRGFGRWFADHTSPEPPYGPLNGLMMMRHASSGSGALLGAVDADLPGADAALNEYLATLLARTDAPAPLLRRLTWLDFVRVLGTNDPRVTTDSTMRIAVKSAYLREPLTREQCAAIHRALTREDYANPTAALTLNGTGGRANTVPPDATAYAHRDASHLLFLENYWQQPDDAPHLEWLRTLYGEIFADTGGYPVPGDRADGCYINSPDPDLVAPGRGAKDVAWHRLFWKDNYARLQRAKRRWDPSDVFRHSHSVRLR